MTAYDRRAELRDIADQSRDHTRTQRGEQRTARRYATQCPDGHHTMRPDGRGGGVCACGAEVGKDEL